MFSLFDAFLGVDHVRPAAGGCAATLSVAGRYQAEQVTYMPSAHRAMMSDFKGELAGAGGAVRAYLQRHAGTGGLGAVAAAHAEAVGALRDFRRFHLGVANAYLGKVASKGTGGTAFKAMLLEAIEGTEAALKQP
jgi:hypothetical protein